MLPHLDLCWHQKEEGQSIVGHQCRQGSTQWANSKNKQNLSEVNQEESESFSKIREMDKGTEQQVWNSW